MDAETAVANLIRDLEDAGFRTAIVPAGRLQDVRATYARLGEDGTLSREFYGVRLAKYDFRLPPDFPEARSIIMTAVRQPRIRIGFIWSGERRAFVIPPTYDNTSDAKAREVIATSLAACGFGVRDPILPWKALAVQSGLAEYGKNNVTYVGDWGSLARLRGFCSDLPAPGDPWREPALMEMCEGCSACLDACPSGAIAEDRFVVRAERCITFFNEEEPDFPEWIDPAWHSCLVGCMVCQDVCPANRAHAAYEAGDICFTEDETAMLLEGIPAERLKPQTVRKLEESTLIYGYETLARNLGVLLRRRA